MAKTWRSYTEESKRPNIGQDCDEGYRPLDNQIKLGAILRIADAAERGVTALEKTVWSYDDLRKERDYLNLKNKSLRENIAFYEKRIAGLKGYINTLKEKQCLKKQSAK